MIKNIDIIQNYIEIIEEKKGLFGIKEHISKIDISLIDKIEKIIENNELIGIVIWHEDTVIHAIGIKNYEKDLEEVYNKILSNIEENEVNVIETKL